MCSIFYHTKKLISQPSNEKGHPSALITCSLPTQYIGRALSFCNFIIKNVNPMAPLQRPVCFYPNIYLISLRLTCNIKFPKSRFPMKYYNSIPLDQNIPHIFVKNQQSNWLCQSRKDSCTNRCKEKSFWKAKCCQNTPTWTVKLSISIHWSN